MPATTTSKPRSPQNDRPNRRTIEALLRDLQHETTGYWRNQPHVDKVAKEYDQLKTKLLKNKKLQRLESQLNKMRNEAEAKRDRQNVLLRDVRQMYQVNGVTDKVIKALNEVLVKFRRPTV